MQPITLYGHGPTPNPIKVALLLEELRLPYTVKNLDVKTEIKAEPFISLNPNGRLPAIEDPNTGVGLFESGAILEYLIETYDKEGRFGHARGSKEYWSEKSWLHFQVSGQGPYFGQRYWFMANHAEKLPSAIERYGTETKRVLGVLDRHLARQGTGFLVGEKLTYVDFAWVPWTYLLWVLLPAEEGDWKEEFPVLAAWFGRLMEREAVRKVYAMEEFQRH